MHIYRFMQSGGKLDLQSDTFEQLKPGLSSYADAPEDAAKSLIPLMESALKTVPTELQVQPSEPLHHIFQMFVRSKGDVSIRFPYVELII